MICISSHIEFIIDNTVQDSSFKFGKESDFSLTCELEFLDYGFVFLGLNLSGYLTLTSSIYRVYIINCKVS
jgi:hypothetical protein